MPNSAHNLVTLSVASAPSHCDSNAHEQGLSWTAFLQACILETCLAIVLSSAATRTAGQADTDMDEDGRSAAFDLFQLAVSLITSPDVRARQVSSTWVACTAAQPNSAGVCEAFREWKTADKAIQLLKSESETAETHTAVILLCVEMHRQQQLPLEELLECGVHEQLASFVSISGMPHQFALRVHP